MDYFQRSGFFVMILKLNNKPMKFTILTLFPKMFQGPFSESIIKRAITRKILDIEIVNLRDFALDKHKTVDDSPYGGGAGMVIKVDVVDRAISSVIAKRPTTGDRRPAPNDRRIIMLSASGQGFNQQKAIELSKYDNIILLCGHYEGFDQRIHDHLVDEEISIGDYVLTGGELPAMVLVDAVSRMVPGVIREESAKNESFMAGQSLEVHKLSSEHNFTTTNDLQQTTYDYPAYTRPEKYRGWKVPEVLLSGNHAEISSWRKREASGRSR